MKIIGRCKHSQNMEEELVSELLNDYGTEVEANKGLV
jgi:hypothetical protein